jgi:hypothetical protein
MIFGLYQRRTKSAVLLFVEYKVGVTPPIVTDCTFDATLLAVAIPRITDGLPV